MLRDLYRYFINSVDNHMNKGYGLSEIYIHDKPISDIYNVGFGKNRSINDIFKDLGGTKKTHTETRKGDVKDTLACVKRIERIELCNYTGIDYNYVRYSKENYKEYLDETVKFYKNESTKS